METKNILIDEEHYKYLVIYFTRYVHIYFTRKVDTNIKPPLSRINRKN